MKKRPLSVGCLIIVSLLSLLAVWKGGNAADYSALEKAKVRVRGTVYQKVVKETDYGSRLELWLEDAAIWTAEGQEAIAGDRVTGVAESGVWQKLPAACDRVICYCVEDVPESFMGSMVEVTGTLRNFEEPSNPGQFDAPSYYQILQISFRLNQADISYQSGAYSRIKEGLYQLRRVLSRRIDDLLPKEEASVMKTMLLGEKGELDEELKGLYQRNGIAHILSISGLHISMLGMGLYQLLRRLGVRIAPSAAVSSVMILLYGVMTGFSVSSVRAIAMFLLQMLAVSVGRTYDMITAIALAAVLLLLSQPRYIFHSGFQFSFLCVVGISLLQPALCNVRSRLLQKLLAGLSMTVVTLPVYLGCFYQLPVYSVFLNFIVLPLMSILMGAGLVMLAVSFLYQPLGILIGSVVVGVLTIYKRLGLLCEQLPMHLWTPGAPDVWQIAVYLLLLALIALFGRTRIKEKRYRREKAAGGVWCFTAKKHGRQTVCGSKCGFAAMIGRQTVRRGAGGYGIGSVYRYLIRYGLPVRFCWCLVAVGILVISLRFRPALLVTFLDVGQGDCIFVQEQDGTSYLVDGGSSSVSEVGKYRIVPFLKYQGADRVKAVFVSHADSDHCNGICELLTRAQKEGITIENLVLPELAEACKEENYRELEALAAQQSIPVSYLHTGQSIRESGVTFRCMHPDEGYVSEDANEASMVLYAAYRDFSLLLTGDVEGQGESLLTERLQQEAESAAVQKSQMQGEKASVAVQQTDMQVQSEAEIANGYKPDAQNTAMQVDVLKVAHHGSRYSTTEAFLQTANPAVAVISCGATNSYGHPHEETLERLTQADVTWFATKDHGAVSVLVERNGSYRVQGYRSE